MSSALPTLTVALTGVGVGFCLFPACSFGTPLAEMLTEQRRTIRKQYETLQQRRALQDMTNHDHCKAILKAGSEVNAITPVSVTPCQEAPPLHLNTAQKLQLQQQLQQVCHLESTNVPFDYKWVKLRPWDCLCLLVSTYSCSPRFTSSVETGTTWCTKPARASNTWSVVKYHVHIQTIIVCQFRAAVSNAWFLCRRSWSSSPGLRRSWSTPAVSGCVTYRLHCISYRRWSREQHPPLLPVLLPPIKAGSPGWLPPLTVRRVTRKFGHPSQNFCWHDGQLSNWKISKSHKDSLVPPDP